MLKKNQHFCKIVGIFLENVGRDGMLSNIFENIAIFCKMLTKTC
jgi:hypothetical protein